MSRSSTAAAATTDTTEAALDGAASLQTTSPEERAVSNHAGKHCLPYIQDQPQTVREFSRNQAMPNSQHPSPQSNLGSAGDISGDPICTSGKHEINGAKPSGSE